MINENSQKLGSSKARIVQTALELFSIHGVNETSLRMIAEKIGVSKAAVYYQFNSKSEIVVAVGNFILNQLEERARQIALEVSPSKRRRLIIDELIYNAVQNRHMASFLQRDPVILRLFEEHDPFRNMMQSIHDLINGGNDSKENKVTSALILTAIGGTVLDPTLSDVDDETLNKQLRLLVHGIARKIS